jgi:hypothetical protein
MGYLGKGTWETTYNLQADQLIITRRYWKKMGYKILIALVAVELRYFESIKASRLIIWEVLVRVW